jgi:hypothetical protein
MKKAYEVPTISELGSVEEFTQGPGGGRFDNLFGISGGWTPGGGGRHGGNNGFS